MSAFAPREIKKMYFFSNIPIPFFFTFTLETDTPTCQIQVTIADTNYKASLFIREKGKSFIGSLLISMKKFITG